MKKNALFLGMMIIAVFIGNLLGDLAAGHSSLAWLGKTYQFGVPTFQLDLKILILTLGFQLKFSAAQVIMITAAVLAYPRVSNSYFS